MEPVAGDLADLADVREAVRGCDIVLHLGAQVSIPHSYAEPWLFVESNIIGTFNVLTAVRELGVSRLVFTSTSEVYGSALYVPMDEEHPLQAQSPYAATKIAAEKLAESYHRSFGVPVVTLRPFNAFGPRQSARAVIPAIISQALWRDEIRLGSLDPLRDFNYVANTVDGFVAAASAPGVEGDVFNIGSGREISIGDLAGLVTSLVGRNVPVASEARRERPLESEVNRLQAGSAKAAAKLGWTPRVSLEDGLRLTIDWIRSHPESFDVARYAT
jgi:dTDP-glucose 4,6-dehydratase